MSNLHAQGITGENVTVAIIDQPLLLNHPEYDGKVEQYHTVGLTDKDTPSSMHGSSVTSLLAGNTIGEKFVNPSAFIDSVRATIKSES